MDDARRFWFCVGAAPGDFSTGAAFRCECHGFENEVVARPIPGHQPWVVLFMPVARPFQKTENESEDPHIWREPKGGRGGEQALPCGRSWN